MLTAKRVHLGRSHHRPDPQRRQSSQLTRRNSGISAIRGGFPTFPPSGRVITTEMVKEALEDFI